MIFMAFRFWLAVGPRSLNGRLFTFFLNVGRLRFHKPVKPHQVGDCRYPNLPSQVGARSLCYGSFGGVFVL